MLPRCSFSSHFQQSTPKDGKEISPFSVIGNLEERYDDNNGGGDDRCCCCSGGGVLTLMVDFEKVDVCEVVVS
jgi:hypothetical protein